MDSSASMFKTNKFLEFESFKAGLQGYIKAREVTVICTMPSFIRLPKGQHDSKANGFTIVQSRDAFNP